MEGEKHEFYWRDSKWRLQWIKKYLFFKRWKEKNMDSIEEIQNGDLSQQKKYLMVYWCSITINSIYDVLSKFYTALVYIYFKVYNLLTLILIT